MSQPDASRAAAEAAAEARGRAMTAFEEHLADAVLALAQSVGQLHAKVDALAAPAGLPATPEAVAASLQQSRHVGPFTSPRQ